MAGASASTRAPPPGPCSQSARAPRTPPRAGAAARAGSAPRVGARTAGARRRPGSSSFAASSAAIAATRRSSRSGSRPMRVSPPAGRGARRCSADHGRLEAPDLAELDARNLAAAREALERIGREAEARGGVLGRQQGFIVHGGGRRDGTREHANAGHAGHTAHLSSCRTSGGDGDRPIRPRPSRVDEVDRSIQNLARLASKFCLDLLKKSTHTVNYGR